MKVSLFNLRKGYRNVIPILKKQSRQLLFQIEITITRYLPILPCVKIYYPDQISYTCIALNQHLSDQKGSPPIYGNKFKVAFP